MQKPFRKILGCSALALALVTTAANPSSQAACYLPRVGPAPLRFQKPRLAKPLALPPLARDDGLPEGSAKTSSIANSALTIDPNFFPNISLQPTQFSGAPLKTVNGDSTHSASGNSVTNSPGGTTANDLLIVSPQMLLDYFRPIDGWTNTAVVAPVPFMPAIPAPPSSSALYKTE
jgi:hypothetical protein